MLFSKHEILEALSSQLIEHNFNSDFTIEEIIIDSRKAAKNTAFIAINGENNDGNKFAANALISGCELAIIDDAQIFQDLNIEAKHNLILVKNSFNSLYEIAKYQRNETKATIIALTGSVGKTSIKDMLKSAFGQIGKTHATSYNLNNHFGLPLTMCNIEKDDDFIILEIGMSNKNEIKPLSDLAKPDVAIISNIAMAHIGNDFNSEKEIALEKSAIFSGLNESGIVILNKDDKYYDFLKEIAINNNIKAGNITSFGTNPESNYRIEQVHSKNYQSSEIVIQSDYGQAKYEIATSNPSVIFNSVVTVACLDLLVENSTKALESFKSFQATLGRGNIVKTKKFTIIDDSYNSNLSSSKAGINYLKELKESLKTPRSVAFIGDMLELGKFSDQSHEELLKFCQEQDIDVIVAIGAEMQKAVKNLCIDVPVYLNCKEASGEIANIVKSQDLILVKGSRGVKMEEIIQILKNL